MAKFSPGLQTRQEERCVILLFLIFWGGGGGGVEPHAMYTIYKHTRTLCVLQYPKNRVSMQVDIIK